MRETRTEDAAGRVQCSTPMEPYEGDWYKDMPWGKGKARSANGDVYDGEWMDGKRANMGECQYTDGSCFVGNFRDGKKHGRGVLTFKSLESVEGYWSQGELVEAVIRSETYIYEGQVKALKPHGTGHMIFAQTGHISSSGNQSQNDVVNGNEHENGMK